MLKMKWQIDEMSFFEAQRVLDEMWEKDAVMARHPEEFTDREFTQVAYMIIDLEARIEELS